MPLAGSQDRPFIYGVTTLRAEHLRLAYHSNFGVDAVELLATEPGRADIEFRAQVRFADGLRGQFEWLLAESERDPCALST